MIETKEHIVNDGVYIPDTGIKYPENPDERIVPNKILNEVKLDETYPYLDKSFYGWFNNFIINTGAFWIAFPLNRLRYGLKIKGRKNITKNKKLLKNGCVTVSNHVYRWDFLAVKAACRRHRMWVIVKGDLVMGKDKFMVRGIGGIPLAENFGGTKKFNEALDYLHSKKKWIHLFPESVRWDFYEPIRPFMPGAFSYAYKWNVPILPMAFSYREPKGIYKLFKMKHPLVTLNIGEPIIPDESLGRKAASEKLLEETHKSIVALAGIKQNMWPSKL